MTEKLGLSGESGLLEDSEAQAFFQRGYSRCQSAWAVVAARERVLLRAGEGQATV